MDTKAKRELRLIDKDHLIEEVKSKMEGLDKAKNYSKWKAYSDCLVLIEEMSNHEITLKDI